MWKQNSSFVISSLSLIVNILLFGLAEVATQRWTQTQNKQHEGQGHSKLAFTSEQRGPDKGTDRHILVLSTSAQEKVCFSALIAASTEAPFWTVSWNMCTKVCLSHMDVSHSPDNGKEGPQRKCICFGPPPLLRRAINGTQLVSVGLAECFRRNSLEHTVIPVTCATVRRAQSDFLFWCVVREDLERPGINPYLAPGCRIAEVSQRGWAVLVLHCSGRLACLEWTVALLICRSKCMSAAEFGRSHFAISKRQSCCKTFLRGTKLTKE